MLAGNPVRTTYVLYLLVFSSHTLVLIIFCIVGFPCVLACLVSQYFIPFACVCNFACGFSICPPQIR